jgi:hypothetical protein
MIEVNATQILDNMIYRANIFNYDSTFLKDIMTKNLKLDFANYIQGRLF